ncbi:hypothetical protein ALI22I_29710 [Saccharothrix sp. ALI-22-I]|nr:hypothetical protein ALI22I_29710 [Saccharothrix sp. ALI-22-I]
MTARRRPARLGERPTVGALIASIPLSASLDVLHLGQVYAVAIASAALSSLTEVAESALVPRVVADEDLEAANSLLSVNWELAYVVGPPTAGLLVGAFDTSAALLVDAARFRGDERAGLQPPRAVRASGRRPLLVHRTVDVPARRARLRAWPGDRRADGVVLAGFPARQRGGRDAAGRESSLDRRAADRRGAPGRGGGATVRIDRAQDGGFWLTSPPARVIHGCE